MNTRSHILTRRRLPTVLIYGIANAQPQLTAAVLVMIYARALTLRDFGTYGILGAAQMVIGIFIEMGIGSAILRNYFDVLHEARARQAYLRSIIRGSRLLALAVLPLLGAALYFSWPSLGVGLEHRLMFVALILTISFFDRSCDILGTVCRALERPGAFATGRAVQGVATILAAFVLVKSMSIGLTGALAAGVVGRFVATASLEILLRSSLGNVSFKVNWKDVRVALAFGAPLVPTRLLAWGRFLALRPLLAHFITMTEMGLFYLASSLSALPAFFSQTLDLALSPLYFKRRAMGETEFHEQSRRFATVYTTALFPFWVGGLIYAPQLIRIFAGAKFEGAVPVSDVLLCAAFVRIQQQFLYRQLHFIRKTGILALAMIPSTVAAVGITLLWADTNGLMAAGWASLVSEIVLMLFLTWTVSCYERVQIPVTLTLMLTGILILVALWGIHNASKPPKLSITLIDVAMTIVAAFGAGLLWLWPERRFITNLLSN